MIKDRKVVIITSCGRKKENKPQISGMLYKSSRIRHLYKRSNELGIPFYILSAKYGLIHSNKIIEPYNQIMTEQRIIELLPQVKEVLKDFDVVIFYQGGAKREYKELIKRACDELKIELISFGYGNMGDIRKLDEILKKVCHK